jgi:hypothetical protein
VRITVSRVTVSRVTYCRRLSLHTGRHWVGHPVLHITVTGGTR